MLASDAVGEGANRAKKAEGAPRLRTRRVEHAMMQPIPPFVPNGAGYDMTRTRLTRLRGFAGMAAAVVVVGLIALLLTHGVGTRGGVGASGTASANATIPPTPGPTQTPGAPLNTQFLQPDQLPVVAPSDPTIVYKIANGALLRSANSGVSFASMALPKTDLSQIDSTSIAVSPLDATHIFVTMGGQKNGQGCLPPTNPYPAIATHGGVMASGYVPCAEQFFSVDSGHTWSQPHLPTSGVLGSLNGNFRSVTGVYGAQSYTFQAQGRRLYAAMAFDDMSGSLVDSPGVRVVASDDGGASWSFVDTNLAASNRYICDFAAAPTGATLYAITGDQQCGGMSYPNLSLWSSVNGGQSWTRVRSLPTLGDEGMVVNGQGALYLYLPEITVQGRGASQTDGPAYALVSIDGGATLTAAPSAGLPASPTLIGPYTTLADGSVVYAASPAPVPQSGLNDLYSWRPGATSWTNLGANVPAGIGAVMATPTSSGAAQQTLIVIDNDGNIFTVKASIG